MDISRKEILRYLGYRGKPADEIVTNSIESCLAELLRIISPKCIYQIFPVTFGENHMVTIGSISIQSKNLSQHINGLQRSSHFCCYTWCTNRLADSKIQQAGYEQSRYSSSLCRYRD